MSGDICDIAAWAYSHGQDPVDYAEQTVRITIEVNFTVMGARMDDPAAFPGYGADTSIAALARRVIGELLDAGWTPPAVSAGDAP